MNTFESQYLIFSPNSHIRRPSIYYILDTHMFILICINYVSLNAIYNIFNGILLRCQLILGHYHNDKLPCQQCNNVGIMTTAGFQWQWHSNVIRRIINHKKTRQNVSCVHNSYDSLYKDTVHLFWLADQEHNNWYEASVIIINAISCSAMCSFLRTNPNIFPHRPCPNNNRPGHDLTDVDLALRPAQYHVGTHGIDRISD